MVPDRPKDVDYLHCIHCGLCLNHCPTYRLWGLEADSPRGRIRQMVLVDEGRLALGESFVRHIDQCLDCRACETACPAGVEYGKLVEGARAQIEQNYRRPLLSRMARSLVYRHLLPYPRRIAAVARACAFLSALRPANVWRASSGLLRLFGTGRPRQTDAAIEQEFFFSRLGQTFPAQGKRRARVALFAGCISQVSFAALHEATIRVLTANGCEVVVPEGQLCCGALAAHAGVRDVARQLARTNLDVFLGEDFDAVITNAAGCGSTLKEYEQLFSADDPAQQKGPRISRENARRHRISRRVGNDRAAARATHARDLSRLLPPGARPENTRSAAAADPRDPRRGTHRNASCRITAAARREFTTSRKRKLRWSCWPRRCIAPQKRAPKPSLRQIRVACCRCAPEAKFTRRANKVLHVVELLDRALDGARLATSRR